jgi:hypothetical protein
MRKRRPKGADEGVVGRKGSLDLKAEDELQGNSHFGFFAVLGEARRCNFLTSLREGLSWLAGGR